MHKKNGWKESNFEALSLLSIQLQHTIFKYFKTTCKNNLFMQKILRSLANIQTIKKLNN